jgi:hypothetical protein
VFYYVGLDLGQSQDYTALAVLETQLWTGPLVSWDDAGVFFPEGVEPGGWVSPSAVGPECAQRILAVNANYGVGPLAPDAPVFVRHLERFELHTRYPEIVEHVKLLLRREPFRRRLRYTRLLGDRTGVGAGVLDSFYEHGVYPISVTIHGGSAVTQEPATSLLSYRVPKRDLVSAVQVPLQNGSLKIAPQMELAPVLKKELLNFRVKIDAKTAHDSYEHWREGDHDDLVLATALAAWYREYERKGEAEEIRWMEGGVRKTKPSEYDREYARQKDLGRS